ncbi:MAG TPA: hypothetical protein VMS12_13200, partial [Thermoanaerobaculia bacterium]|nr:hypothetical protein [Thermoanaerobaculia bacterium]
MNRTLLLILTLTLLLSFDALAQSRSRVNRPTAAAPEAPNRSPADCAGQAFQTVCREGGSETFRALSAAEAANLVRAPFVVLDNPRMTAAVVDRTGRVLSLIRGPLADPADDMVAVGVARTAAFFSHDMAPLTSRTVRFISGVHFPPGVRRAPPAAL